jgi:hypothetical protein
MVTSLADLCSRGDASGGQVCLNREPFLLVPYRNSRDVFFTLAIHDTQTDPNPVDGYYRVQIDAGSVMLRPDTLVFWK